MKMNRAPHIVVPVQTGTHLRSLSQIMWQRGIPRPFPFPYVAFTEAIVIPAKSLPHIGVRGRNPEGLGQFGCRLP